MKMTELQFRLIKENLKVLTSKPCFYKEKFKDIDIDAIKSQEDFEKLPFTWKGDLRDAYPLGLQDAPIHSSIGESRTFALGFCFCADFSCPASVCPCGRVSQGVFLSSERSRKI